MVVGVQLPGTEVTLQLAPLPDHLSVGRTQSLLTPQTAGRILLTSPDPNLANRAFRRCDAGNEEVTPWQMDLSGESMSQPIRAT